MTDAFDDLRGAVFPRGHDRWETRVLDAFVDSAFRKADEGIARVEQKVARKTGRQKVVAFLVASCLASQKANLTVYAKNTGQARSLAEMVQSNLARITGTRVLSLKRFPMVFYDAKNLAIECLFHMEGGPLSFRARFSCVDKYHHPPGYIPTVVVAEDRVTPEELEKNKHTTIISFVPTQEQE